jgi:hypothetical protein
MAQEKMTLAEGADRFDRLARILKDKQRAQTSTRPTAEPPVGEVFVQSPDEAWAKQYMTHCIGPVCYTPVAEPPGFVKFPAMPPQAQSRSAVLEARPPQPAKAQPAERAAPGPIGQGIGKAGRKRSWLARLFGRR